MTCDVIFTPVPARTARAASFGCRSVRVEARGAGQQDELNVRERGRLEGGGDVALPAQRDVPRQEARALLALVDHRAVLSAATGSLSWYLRPQSGPR
jgi:hypothetical protein